MSTIPEIERIALQLHEAALRGSEALNAAFDLIPKGKHKNDVWGNSGAFYKTLAAKHDQSLGELDAAEDGTAEARSNAVMQDYYRLLKRYPEQVARLEESQLAGYADEENQ